MLPFLRQRWFMLTLLTGLLTAALQPILLHWTRWPDPRLVVGTALFLTAWSLPARNLLQALRRPLAAVWATALSYGLVPALACLLGLLAPSEDFRLGLLISASVPSTVASSILWTRLAGGDEAVALVVTVLTTSTSWLLTTVWVTGMAGVSIALSPLEMMFDLVLALVVPVLLGEVLQFVPPFGGVARRHKPLLAILSQLCILIIVLRAAVAVCERVIGGEYDLGPLTLVLAVVLPVGVHLLALGAGFYSSLFLGFGRPASIAVAISCSQKTLPVAMLLFEGYFIDSHPLAVLPLAFYHFGQLIADTFFADRVKRHAPKANPEEVR